MTQSDLKDFIRNAAAKPIRIFLADGASYKISHPDFAFTTTESLILASGPGHDLGPREFIVCPIHHITRLEVMRKTGAAKS